MSTTSRTHWRAFALAGVLISAVAASVPAYAAPDDIALLKGYLGSWKGRGIVQAKQAETISCKLSLTDGNNEKVNYDGRCALAGASLAIHGTLAYIDASRRYEAAMTSNTSFQGVAVGRKQGDGVVFNLKEVGKNEGADIAITAGIALQRGAISVDFQVVDVASGNVTKATIPFSK
ncbi:MAG: hypothetical protein JWN11_830 [Hyphomicrobiales bacterium]|nr:hypothetical protein [Hyphomicrobiales bacterium]